MKRNTFLLSFITALFLFILFQYKNDLNNKELNYEVFAFVENENNERKKKIEEQIQKQKEIDEISKRIEENKKEEIKLNSAPEKIITKKKKVVKEEFATLKQGLNTCFFDSISVIHLNDNGERLDINKIYKKMGMNYGDYFLPGSYSYSRLSGGRFSHDKYGDGLKKIEDIYGFGFNQLVSTSLIEDQLDSGEQGIFIAPMKYFDKSDKWKDGKIWHAVAVYQIDQDFIYFTNTLNSKLEKLSLDKISNNGIMIYPILFTDNKNFLKLK